MAAYFPSDKSLKSRVFNLLERTFSRVYFNRAFLRGDKTGKAKLMNVHLRPFDLVVFAALGLFIFGREKLYALALRVPALREATDKRLIDKIDRLLVGYGHAEYTTDAAKYKDESIRGQHAKAA